MVYWNGNRHREKYDYVRVSWDDWQELEEYERITGGSIELSSVSSLKVSGNFTLEGAEDPDTLDMMRVYYSFEDDNGEKAREPIATFFLESSNRDIEAIFSGDRQTGVMSSGAIDGLSVLSVLDRKKYGRPYTVTRNTNAVYKAQEMIRECGLNVSYEPCGKILESDHTFGSSDSYLTIVNWLCGVSGYHEATPDAMGTVRLMPSDWSSRQIIFRNDEESIMYPQIKVENDWQETPNVVRIMYNTEKACAYAEARNLSGSKASLESRGSREITYTEDIGEIDTSISLVKGLQNAAEDKLKELSADVEYVSIDHAYIPIEPDDTVRIEYGDMTWEGTAETVKIELEPSTKTNTSIRKMLDNQIVIESSCIVMRGDDDG